MTLLEILYTIALGLFVFIVFLWVVIGYSIIVRKFRNVSRFKIDAFFIQELSIAYAKSNGLDTPTALPDTSITTIKLKKERKLQYASNILIRVQDTFYSENDKMIEELCKESGIFNAIQKKITKRHWYQKAMGIWLSYELDLRDNLEYIKPLTSHKNILVRREAQIGLVRFWGWKSLKIVPQIKYPISLWQQIRIIEKLMDYYPIPDITYMKKALETQNPYGIELLIRIIRRFEIKEYTPYIIKQIAHANRSVVDTAIEVLETIDLDANHREEIENMIVTLPLENRQAKSLQHIINNKYKKIK